MKLKLPKRSDYFDLHDYMAARALIAMANLALSKGATETEVIEVEQLRILGFVNSPVADAILKARK